MSELSVSQNNKTTYKTVRKNEKCYFTDLCDISIRLTCNYTQNPHACIHAPCIQSSYFSVCIYWK